MKRLLRENIAFLIPWGIVVALCIAMMAIVPRIEMHQLLNSRHTETLDLLFRTLTEVGGNLPWVVCAVMLAVRMWKGVMLTLSQIIGTVIVTPLKHLFHHPRPLTVFSEAGIPLPTVEGVKLHAWNSFPSGHTAAAFALLFGIAVMVPKWWQKVLCLVLALLVGYSRIYLSQHFIDDVVAGSVIGVLSVILAMMFFNDKTDKWHKNENLKATTD